MKSIYSLVTDIQWMLKENENWITDEVRKYIANGITDALVASSSQRAEGTKRTLRLSQMGPRCPRALWHSIHTPSLAEPLPPSAIIKFTYGHIIESLIIQMAKASGHDVQGEQDVIVLDGIQGHRDCVIDGCIVDVKSSSSLGFQKFKDGTIRSSDSFGYLDQLDGYIVGSLADPLVTVKDRGFLLAVDKQLGHLALYEHKARPDSIRNRIKEYKDIVSLAEAPRCTCGTIADGKSGNIRLDTVASYNTYKHCCFPNLRTFLYSGGPRYLTKVVRVPDVPEVNKDGKIING